MQSRISNVNFQYYIVFPWPPPIFNLDGTFVPLVPLLPLNNVRFGRSTCGKGRCFRAQQRQVTQEQTNIILGGGVASRNDG